MNHNNLTKVLLLTSVGLLLGSVVWLALRVAAGGEVDPNLLVSFVSAGALVLAAVIANVSGKIQQSRIQIEEDLRERRKPVYRDMVEFFMKLMTNVPGQRKPVGAEMQKFMAGLTPQLLLWGSDEVVMEWSNWRKKIIRQEQGLEEPVEGTAYEVILDFERLIYALRRDLGYTGDLLRQGDILGLFVNDVHKLVMNPKLIKDTGQRRV